MTSNAFVLRRLLVFDWGGRWVGGPAEGVEDCSSVRYLVRLYCKVIQCCILMESIFRVGSIGEFLMLLYCSCSLSLSFSSQEHHTKSNNTDHN